MGMSASQVRLLTITKRIHSVENEAERIQNQKMLLGLQSDEAYEEYLAAMEKKDIEYAWFNGNTGNFEWDDLDLRTVYDLINITGTDYRLKVRNINNVQPITINVTGTPTDASTPTISGFSVVDDEAHPGKYKYVLNGITLLDNQTSQNPTYFIYNDIKFNVAGNNITADVSTPMPTTTYSYTLPDGTQGTATAYNELGDIPQQTSSISYNGETFTLTLKQGINVVTIPSTEEFIECNNIQEVCAVLNITEASALTDKTIFRELIYNAYAIIESKIYDEDLQQNVWKETSVATNTGLREKTDDQALALAEANYEAALRKIDKKEEQYDKDLAKFDQERKALTTQLDTLKTCIKENIDRTFKIFQG